MCIILFYIKYQEFSMLIIIYNNNNIYAGPDICGPGTKKVHVIFSYKDKNLLINKDIRCKDDIYTHLYTLIVKPDNTYKVQKKHKIVA